MEPSARRILALWLPRLPTDRLKLRWKASGRLDKRPLVTAGKIDNALQVTAVDAKAAGLGLYPGKALADARAMVPELAVIRANAAADLTCLETIADWCERYTPLVALDPPHGLFLDVTGAAHLFGGERALLEHIALGVGAQGFSVALALAGTAHAARALAQYRPNTIARVGCDAQAVGSLPTDALNTHASILHALKRAGLKTIGQVAARQPQELTARFGKAFFALLECTLGRNGGPIMPRTPRAEIIAEKRFAEPIVTEAAIGETILILSESLVRGLEKRGQGARVLEALFFRADGQRRGLTIETGQPIRDPQGIVRLFREKMAALRDPLDPGFGFDLIRLCAAVTQDMDVRTTSLDTKAFEPDVAFLIDTLSARFGAQRVLRFQPQDTHIPEGAAIAVPVQQGRSVQVPWARLGEAAPRRPLRLFAKAEPVEVLASSAYGAPLRFSWRRALHVVTEAEGPERIAMEWWRQQGPARDYFRVEDACGRRFWLYREESSAWETVQRRWFMHGRFA